MILQYVASLNTKRIVLASGSPRRKELLGNIGLKFEVKLSIGNRRLCASVASSCVLGQHHTGIIIQDSCVLTGKLSCFDTGLLQIIVSSFEETLPHHWFENAADYAVETAKHKALDVAQVVAAQQGTPPVDLIISADTVSACGVSLAYCLWRFKAIVLSQRGPGAPAAKHSYGRLTIVPQQFKHAQSTAVQAI